MDNIKKISTPILMSMVKVMIQGSAMRRDIIKELIIRKKKQAAK